MHFLKNLSAFDAYQNPLLFWVFFLGLGLLLPLVIEIFESVPAALSQSTVHYNQRLTAATAILVLAGGFLLRYIFGFLLDQLEARTGSCKILRVMLTTCELKLSKQLNC